MEKQNVCFHTVLRTVDPGLMDKAVNALQADSTIDEVVRIDDVWREDEFFVVCGKACWNGQGFLPARYLFIARALLDCKVTEERILIKINTIQYSSDAFKGRVFHERGNGERSVFSNILNLALRNMLVQADVNPNGNAMEVDLNMVVLCRIETSIFRMILCDFSNVVKPGWL